ncbi:TraA family conjugative transfer protein [Thiocystis violacea]|uniref:TraA family conjugative transfer protein n=1 Tax=Thiocystis violacea TaxID=13725 RepID=UPI0019083152|nr:TraA family conjugative transfer protein [Thiocystis violacea]MBK1717302.1 pili assembly chaperone [Thiocystis violacea]
MLNPPPPRALHLAGRLLLVAVALAPMLAFAGEGTGDTTGTEFQVVYTLITGWMTGLLGKIIAVSFILVGLVAGVMRQSIMGFVVGVAAGVGMLVAPNVINTLFTATLPLA